MLWFVIIIYLFLLYYYFSFFFFFLFNWFLCFSLWAKSPLSHSVTAGSPPPPPPPPPHDCDPWLLLTFGVPMLRCMMMMMMMMMMIMVVVVSMIAKKRKLGHSQLCVVLFFFCFFPPWECSRDGENTKVNLAVVLTRFLDLLFGYNRFTVINLLCFVHL